MLEVAVHICTFSYDPHVVSSRTMAATEEITNLALGDSSVGAAAVTNNTPTAFNEASAEADRLKAEANTFFKAEKYAPAADLYTQALELRPDNAVLYANRSIANLRLENFGYALSDANRAIECDRTYLKAYYRRAAAHMALGKYKLALKDYERVYKVSQNKFEACYCIAEEKQEIAEAKFAADASLGVGGPQ